jgi:hypothetical protein
VVVITRKLHLVFVGAPEKDSNSRCATGTKHVARVLTIIVKKFRKSQKSLIPQNSTLSGHVI